MTTPTFQNEIPQPTPTLFASRPPVDPRPPSLMLTIVLLAQLLHDFSYSVFPWCGHCDRDFVPGKRPVDNLLRTLEKSFFRELGAEAVLPALAAEVAELKATAAAG